VGPGQHTWTIDPIQNMNQGLFQPPLDSESGFLNPVYIDNLIDALLLMGVHPAAPGQIFNVVDGTPIRANDYFRRLAQMAGKQLTPLPAKIYPSKIQSLLGSTPAVQHEEAFLRTERWLHLEGYLRGRRLP